MIPGPKGERLGSIVAWTWTAIAGGGGLLLLTQQGPWPLTNGWFALLSGMAACPQVAWILEKHARIVISGYVRLAAAVLFFIAGRIALAYQ